ncbi:MAG: hypothetical protein IT364_02790 [Candidatus Hydrogenedentes bacterium]|nr:hypothetical protein [Candidatus Hydrogenedentota bacterium]
MNEPHLTVAREPFRVALRRLARTGKRSSEPAAVAFEAGELILAWAGSTEHIAASGEWPEVVRVSAGWVRVLARRLHDRDPVNLRVREGRLFVENYGQLCLAAADALPELAPVIPAGLREKRIRQAASVLKPLLVTEGDLADLTEAASQAHARQYSVEEHTMLKRIAQAWALLAPFGIETAEIYQLVQHKVRHAFIAVASTEGTDNSR